MRIALAQLNPLIGDLEGNGELILAACQRAAQAGADLVLTPELSLWGYPPRDLLLRPALVRQQHRQLEQLARSLPPKIGVLVGMADPVPGIETPGLWNALALLKDGAWQVVAHKRLLPATTCLTRRATSNPDNRAPGWSGNRENGSGTWG